MFDYATKGEAQVATRIIDKALAQGLTVSVHDGLNGEGQWTVKLSTDREAIRSALNSTEGDTLRFRNASGDKLGDILLIWGNAADGSELIADHSDNAFMNEFTKEFM